MRTRSWGDGRVAKRAAGRRPHCLLVSRLRRVVVSFGPTVPCWARPALPAFFNVARLKAGESTTISKKLTKEQHEAMLADLKEKARVRRAASTLVERGDAG